MGGGGSSARYADARPTEPANTSMNTHGLVDNFSNYYNYYDNYIIIIKEIIIFLFIIMLLILLIILFFKCRKKKWKVYKDKLLLIFK